MDTRVVRADLEQARTHVRAGEIDQALVVIDHALRALAPERLLTTTEAARELGIRSVNTLKVLLRTEGVCVTQHGNRTMVPLAEVERLRGNLSLRRLRALDRQHDAIADLGAPDGLSEEELDELEAGRPGRLPWTSPAEVER